MDYYINIMKKEMATHSSTLAWKIPWTEDPGGLQSTGSQSRTRLHFHFHINILYKGDTSIKGRIQKGKQPPSSLELLAIFF